jgi:predicted DCC family thiol-disulfide oxidoreductase YuxK
MPPVLLYDGLCAMCNRAVLFVLKRDHTHSIRFAPLQGELAGATLARHPSLADEDSIIFLRGDEVLVKSDAALAVATYLSAPWRFLSHFKLVPRPLRDAVYDLVARNRFRVAKRYESCPLPPADVRERFLA